MLFVHTNHATKEGSPEGVLMAKPSDTDIICIAVSQYNVRSPRNWSRPADNCMWPNPHWRWIPVHELCVSIGPQKSRAFTPSPITRFDVVSTFCDKEKKMR